MTAMKLLTSQKKKQFTQHQKYFYDESEKNPDEKKKHSKIELRYVVRSSTCREGEGGGKAHTSQVETHPVQHSIHSLTPQPQQPSDGRQHSLHFIHARCPNLNRHSPLHAVCSSTFLRTFLLNMLLCCIVLCPVQCSVALCSVLCCVVLCSVQCCVVWLRGERAGIQTRMTVGIQCRNVLQDHIIWQIHGCVVSRSYMFFPHLSLIFDSSEIISLYSL